MNPTPSDMVAEIAVQKAAAAKNGTLFPDKRASKSGRRVQGLGAVFYSPSESGTEYWLYEGLVERIAKTAFDSALARKDDCLFCLNHDSHTPLARTTSGTLTLTITPRGLHYSAELGHNAPADYAISAIERGDIFASSFSFSILRESYEEKSDGVVVRTIEDCTLHDVSAVTNPAYTGTEAAVRSYVTPQGNVLDRGYRFRSKSALLQEIEKSESRYFAQQNAVSRTIADRAELSLNTLLRLRNKLNLFA